MTMQIKHQCPSTVVLDAREFAQFVESARHACSVALGDLLALGMPSPATSTGRLLTAVLHDAQTILADVQRSEELIAKAKEPPT